MADTQTIQVPAEASGLRLDTFLARQLDQPRNQVQQWIRAGRVRIAGRAAKASHALEAGEQIEYLPLERQMDDAMEPEPGELRLLHEDSEVAVVDKPAELAVHPGAGRPTGTLAHRLLQHFPETARVGGPGRPGIVHRLDIDTTGVLVVARTQRAYRALSAQFAERRVHKRYLAMVYGRPQERSGTIDQPIGRHPSRRKEMTVRPGGRPARTDFHLIAGEQGISLLDLELATGRTHQIRVHLKAFGHPLIGDPVYGEARWKGLPREVQRSLREFPRPALHAWRLRFEHPSTGAPMRFEAPIPTDLELLWREVTGRELPELPAW